MSAFALVLLLTCTPTALLDFAIPKWKADKYVRIEDAYKWTYQATRGGEHAVPDEESARKWLDDEWQKLGKPSKTEPFWEPLCPNGEIGRLNLRRYNSHGGSRSDDVLEAFLASSRGYKTDQLSFTDAWLELGERLKKQSIDKIDYKAWVKLDAEMKAKNYPAIHHSKKYEKVHHPAYRVLTNGEWQKLKARLK